MFDIIRKLLLDAKNEAISLNTVYSNCEKSGLPPNVVDEYGLYVYVNKNAPTLIELRCLYKQWKHVLFIDQQKNTVQSVV